MTPSRDEMRCPRCRGPFERRTAALSRADDRTRICEACGTEEALMAWPEGRGRATYEQVARDAWWRRLAFPTIMSGDRRRLQDDIQGAPAGTFVHVLSRSNWEPGAWRVQFLIGPDEVRSATVPASALGELEEDG